MTTRLRLLCLFAVITGQWITATECTTTVVRDITTPIATDGTTIAAGIAGTGFVGDITADAITTTIRGTDTDTGHIATEECKLLVIFVC